jgi:hypothetical protein
VGLLALSLWLVWWPRTALALDSFIFRPPADPLALPQESSEHVEPQTNIHR